MNLFSDKQKILVSYEYDWPWTFLSFLSFLCKFKYNIFFSTYLLKCLSFFQDRSILFICKNVGWSAWVKFLLLQKSSLKYLNNLWYQKIWHSNFGIYIECIRRCFTLALDYFYFSLAYFSVFSLSCCLSDFMFQYCLISKSDFTYKQKLSRITLNISDARRPVFLDQKVIMHALAFKILVILQFSRKRFTIFIFLGQFWNEIKQKTSSTIFTSHLRLINCDGKYI